MHNIDLSAFNIRTDLIIDDESLVHEEIKIDNIKVTTTENNGNYITIAFEDITDFDNREEVGKQLEKMLKKILKLNNIKETDSCLIIGLGNRLSTPDSLGVNTINDIVVTSHLFKLGEVKKGIRKVSAITPGVLASTGIESFTIINAIIKETKPDFVIAVDALASKNIDRLNKTIQITDTGIHPGSGVGNNRIEISQKTIGIPVIAIGVPTVTSSVTIVYDTINYLFKHISYLKNHDEENYLPNYKERLKTEKISDEDKNNLLGIYGTLKGDEQRNLIDEVLTNTELNLIVTPTEIDFLIEKLSNLIASSINNALHRQINHF